MVICAHTYKQTGRYTTKRLKILIETDKINSAHPNFRIGYKFNSLCVLKGVTIYLFLCSFFIRKMSSRTLVKI